MTGKLPFHVRGAATATAIGLARKLALPESAGERLLDAILGALWQDEGVLPAAPGYLVAPGGPEPTRGDWPPSCPIATLGQHHGTVLLAGEEAPRTYRVGYRGLDGVVRLADTGGRADWAAVWWPLP